MDYYQLSFVKSKVEFQRSQSKCTSEKKKVWLRESFVWKSIVPTMKFNNDYCRFQTIKKIKKSEK